MNIGNVARLSGVSTKMIRYYEQTGLIPPARRGQSGYRVYRESDVHTLRFIRRARDLGFSIAQVVELLTLWSDRNRASADVKRIAHIHITELDVKIGELGAMRDALKSLADHCHGDHRPECPILEDLAAAGASETKPLDLTRFSVKGLATLQEKPRRRNARGSSRTFS